MIGKNNAVTFSTKGQGFKIKLFEFLVYLEPVDFPKHHKRISKRSSRLKYQGRDPFNQNFWKFWSKTQWIGLVQPEKFRRNGSTF